MVTDIALLPSPTILFAACVIVAAGSFVQAGPGMGFGSTVAPLFLVLPATVASLFFARRLKGRFDRRYRLWLTGLAGATAILLIVKGLW